MEQKTQIPKSQIVSLAAVFILGTTTVVSPGHNLGKYSYISILLAFGAYLLLLGLYYLLARLEPKENLFTIHELAYGKILGTIINLFYLVYFFVVTTLVVSNFVDFINTTILVRTPDLVISALLVSVIAYSVRAGLRALAKFSEITLIMSILTVVVVTLLIIELMEPLNFMPLIPADWGDIFNSSLTVFTFPFGEMIILLGLVSILGKPEKVFRSFSVGSVMALALILITVVRNTLVLGDFSSMTTYPSFETARLINIAQVFTRTEVFVVLNFIFNGFFKATLGFYSLSRGIKETFKLKSYKHLVLPIGALVTLNVHLSFPSVLQNIYFNREFYRYYALVPQVALIIITYVVLLLKKRRKAK